MGANKRAGNAIGHVLTVGNRLFCILAAVILCSHTQAQTLSELDLRVLDASIEEFTIALADDASELYGQLVEAAKINEGVRIDLRKNIDSSSLLNKEALQRYFMKVLTRWPARANPQNHDTILIASTNEAQEDLTHICQDEAKVMEATGRFTNCGTGTVVAAASLTGEFTYSDKLFYASYHGELILTRVTSSVGRTVSVNGWALTGAGVYTSILLPTLLACILLFELIRYQRLVQQVAISADDSCPQEGLQLIRERPNRRWLNGNKLKNLQHELEESRKLSEKHFLTAINALSDEDYTRAARACEQALSEDSQHQGANKLNKIILSNIPHARELLRQARQIKDSNLPDALALYVEAKQLNPYLGTKIASEMALLEADDPTTRSNSSTYERFAKIDAALARLIADDPEVIRLQMRRKTLASTIVTQGDLILEGPWGQIIFTSRSSITIGRHSSQEAPADIAIKHKRLSRPSKQTDIYYQEGSFWVMDKGSANGTLVGSHLIEPRVPVSIPASGAIISMGGYRENQERGSCRYALHPTPENPASLLVAVDPTMRYLHDENTDSNLWASLERDALHFHVLIKGPVMLSGSEKSPIITNSCDPSIRKQAVLIITPTHTGYKIGSRNNGEFYVDDSLLLAPVPLAERVSVRIGKLAMTVEIKPQATKTTFEVANYRE